MWLVIQGVGGASEEPAELALPAPGQLVATATVRVAQTFDRIGDWLARLPANPVTDFLSGALLLVRRTLLPNVPAIQALTISNVSVLEGDTGTNDAVLTVTLDKAYGTPVTVGYAITGGSAPDAAAAGVDYTPASGLLVFAPGQTSQQVPVTALRWSSSTVGGMASPMTGLLTNLPPIVGPVEKLVSLFTVASYLAGLGFSIGDIVKFIWHKWPVRVWRM